MTTPDLDLPPAAVEQLLSLPRIYLDHEGDLCCERSGDNLVGLPALGAYPTGGLLNPDMWEAIPKFQALAKALAAENERLRGEVQIANDGWHYAEGCAELAMKHRDEAEAENERLRAVLLPLVNHQLFHDREYLSQELNEKLDAARAALPEGDTP